MNGQEVAERFWGVLRARGFKVMDGDWDATSADLKAAWEDFATDLNTIPRTWENPDAVIEWFLTEDEKLRQRMYELLYAAGHRIR